jgi:hypothetical protein
MTDRELAIVLAALRYWQRNVVVNRVDKDIADIATNFGQFGVMSDTEIDELCERLNS